MVSGVQYWVNNAFWLVLYVTLSHYIVLMTIIIDYFKLYNVILQSKLYEKILCIMLLIIIYITLFAPILTKLYARILFKIVIR